MSEAYRLLLQLTYTYREAETSSASKESNESKLRRLIARIVSSTTQLRDLYHDTPSIMTDELARTVSYPDPAKEAVAWTWCIIPCSSFRLKNTVGMD